MLSPRHLLVSLALHAVLVALLVVNVPIAPPVPSVLPRPPQKPIVQVEAVSRHVVEQKIQRIRDEAAERIRQEEKRRLEKAERIRLEEEKRRLEKAERIRLEEEKRRLEKAERMRLEEEKRRLEEAERIRLEEEKHMLEEAERMRLEEEKRRLEEAERIRQEEEQRKLAEQQARDQVEIDHHKGLIIDRIANKFNRVGLPEGLTCTLLIRVTPGGEIVRADIVESSGNELFDRRAQEAVYAAAPLPLPEEQRVFNQMRTIRTIFRPWDE